MFRKQKMVNQRKAALFLALALCLGTTGCAADVMASKIVPQVNYTVLEKGEETGIPIVIEWNGKQYALDFDAWIELKESSDNGKTWQSYVADYDTMTMLFSNLGIELYTYDEFLELIKGYKKAVQSTDEEWLKTMAWYDGLAEQWKKEGTLETYFPIMKGLRFSYEVDVPGTGTETHAPPSSYYLPQLYQRLHMSLEYDMEAGYLTQSQADAIMQQFMKEFNLPR